VARWAAICAAPLVLELALFLVIESSGQDFGWKHARMNGLWWLTAGQAVTVLVGTGVLADRRGADRAPARAPAAQPPRRPLRQRRRPG